MRYWKKYTCLFACCFLFVFSALFAQDSAFKPLKIAVFAPVYLDSAFDGNDYKLGNTNSLPRYMLPGLDFYNGISLAIDSLNAEHARLEVLFYDSKGAAEPLNQVLQKPELTGISMIIASFNSRNEIKPVADFALQKNIPLVSVTYPNDGGLTANPFFVLINPTLPTHCEGLYHYLQRVYPTSSMVMFRKKGPGEDLIQSEFAAMARQTAGVPLKIKTVELPDGFTAQQVASYLDSTRQNIVICGSLNEIFGVSLVKALDESKNYSCIAIGMPTWDALKELDKVATEIIYSTPFTYNYLRKDKTGQQLVARYRTRFQGRPSDMVFKGFEAMYHFGRLLLKHNSSLISNLSDKDFGVFNEFDIQPVRLNKEHVLPDYLENKKLYFIRKAGGQLKSMN
ncbi:MAG TPA: hypothetical protein VM187_07635 [Niastella sp.]|nr:hypothetical protein [Niastella sp.]